MRERTCSRCCSRLRRSSPLAAAGARRSALVRDAEIEATLERIAYPMFRAAGLNPGTVNIYIVNDPEPNAFVAGGAEHLRQHRPADAARRPSTSSAR